MAIIAYFKDASGNELPYSGWLFASCGSFVGGTKNRFEMEVRKGNTLKRLTVEDFGGKTVNVKIWAAGGSEYWQLVSEPKPAAALPIGWREVEA